MLSGQPLAQILELLPIFLGFIQRPTRCRFDRNNDVISFDHGIALPSGHNRGTLVGSMGSEYRSSTSNYLLFKGFVVCTVLG